MHIFSEACLIVFSVVYSQKSMHRSTALARQLLQSCLNLSMSTGLSFLNSTCSVLLQASFFKFLSAWCGLSIRCGLLNSKKPQPLNSSLLSNLAVMLYTSCGFQTVFYGELHLHWSVLFICGFRIQGFNSLQILNPSGVVVFWVLIFDGSRGASGHIWGSSDCPDSLMQSGSGRQTPMDASTNCNVAKVQMGYCRVSLLVYSFCFTMQVKILLHTLKTVENIFYVDFFKIMQDPTWFGISKPGKN